MTERPVVVLADDLIWSTRLVAAIRTAGGEPVAVRTLRSLEAALRVDEDAAVIVDLTARAYDGVEAVAAAVAIGASVLAVGQHDDLALRRRALAAGARRVVAYRRLADHGPATIAAWLADRAPGTPVGSR